MKLTTFLAVLFGFGTKQFTPKATPKAADATGPKHAPRVKLHERYHVEPAVAEAAAKVALRMLKDPETHRVEVSTIDPASRMFEFWNDSMRGWTVRLIRPFGIRHSWLVIDPSGKRRVLLPAAYCAPLDEAEFHDDERRRKPAKTPTLRKSDAHFLDEASKLA